MSYSVNDVVDNISGIKYFVVIDDIVKSGKLISNMYADANASRQNPYIDRLFSMPGYKSTCYADVILLNSSLVINE